MTGNSFVSERELKIAGSIRLSYVGNSVTDIVVYTAWLDCIPIFGFATSSNGKYNSNLFDDLLSTEQRANILKHLNDYRARGCRFRTILIE